MDPLATLDDLESFLGADLDHQRGAVVLELASSRVRTAAAQTWATPESVPATARVVTLQLAARLYANPTGDTQVVTGPFSVSRTVGLTSDELIGLAALRPTGGLSTLTTTRGDDLLDLGTRVAVVGQPDKDFPYL